MKCRHILKFAGSALATMGASQLDIMHRAERHGQVIAQNLSQSNTRKLALLVGVGDYPDSSPNLPGCLTDVELPYKLLVNRYGFKPDDIVKISGNEPLKPTRETLIQQLRIQNEGAEQALYFSGLSIDATGNMTVVYPERWDAPEDAALIEPKTALVVPRPDDGGLEFTVNGAGFFEIVTIVSAGSLRNALRGLQEIARGRNVSAGYLPLDGGEGTNFLRTLLSDFDQIFRGAYPSSSRYASDETVVDVGRLQSLRR